MILTEEGTPDKETATEDTPVETVELSTYNNCIGTNKSEFVVLCGIHQELANSICGSFIGGS